MIKTAMVGLGKMGLSHLSILRAHPDLDVVAGCDATTYLTDILSKHAGLKCYADFDDMLRSETLDALVVATPSKLHAPMVQAALDHGLDVFCEKPFVLDVDAGERLIELARSRERVTQVGYHYRFVGAFKEAARLVRSGALGTSRSASYSHSGRYGYGHGGTRYGRWARYGAYAYGSALAYGSAYANSGCYYTYSYRQQGRVRVCSED